MKRLLGALLLFVACATTPKTETPAPAPAPVAAVEPAATTETLSDDAPRATPSGITFVVPKGWSMKQQGDVTTFTPPEAGSRLVLYELDAATPEAARDAALKQYQPGFSRELIASAPRPDRDGWSKQVNYNYRSAPSEKREVSVETSFANQRFLVLVYDFANDVSEKRGAQLELLTGRLYPKGYTRESFKDKKANVIDAARLAELQKFVRDAQALTKVPGVSFGLVQNGKVVFSGGYGVRALGSREPVDGKTLYLIASNTKGLTTLMLAKLVDEQKLAWSDVATTRLPQFRLGSAETTKQVQVKHLICACTGMPRQDLEFLLEWKGSTPASNLDSLATMEPTSKFGELYQYSNPMAAAGGFLGGHVAYPNLELGAAYDKAMQTRVFEPLGMRSTTFDFAKALKNRNHALPHGPGFDDQMAPAVMDENYCVVSVRPAGGAWSNVDDMLAYVQMELSEGKLPNGKQYISREPLLERRAAQVSIGEGATYGMGLEVHRAWDVEVVRHGGNIIGFHSDMIWVPSANVGAVILTNGDPGNIIVNNFRRKLLEVLYDGRPEADENVAARAKAVQAWREGERKSLSRPADAEAVATLAPKYRNAALGTVTVGREGATLVLDFGEFKSEAATRKNADGTVTLVTISPGVQGFELTVTAAADGKRGLVMRDGQHEYVFSE